MSETNKELKVCPNCGACLVCGRSGYMSYHPLLGTSTTYSPPNYTGTIVWGTVGGTS